MIHSLSAHQIRLLRIHAQGLSGTGLETKPSQVAKKICGIQAQDLPAAHLSIRARSKGITDAHVVQARQIQRSLAWTWCMRGTLHLVAAEDAKWLVPFLGPASIAADQRRFEQLGWNDMLADTAIHLVHEALSQHGKLTRPEIIQLLATNGLPSQGQAPIHLLYRAAMQSMICYGPDRGKESTFVLFDEWLGAPQPLPYEAALAEIARRYLSAYGPASSDDLANWSGLKRSEAREAWQLIADEIVQIETAGFPAWMLKTSLPLLDEAVEFEPRVRLLPRFDTYLLGYADRNLVVEPEFARQVHPGGGIIHPVLLVDGKAAGTWKVKRRKAAQEIMIEPFKPLASSLLPQIEAEVADLARFLGERATLNILKPD